MAFCFENGFGIFNEKLPFCGGALFFFSIATRFMMYCTAFGRVFENGYSCLIWTHGLEKNSVYLRKVLSYCLHHGFSCGIMARIPSEYRLWNANIFS